MARESGVLLVEDHPLMRQGIRSLIGDTAELRVVAEASSLAEARKLIATNKKIALVLLDLSLPDGSGLDLIRELREGESPLPIVVLTMHNEGPYLSNAISLGADGYVVKDMAPERLIQTIRAALAGEKCFFTSKVDQPLSSSPSLKGEALSAREEMVRELLVEGNSLTDIAEQLALSVKTVFTYRARLLKKLGFKNNAELIKNYVKRQF